MIRALQEGGAARGRGRRIYIASAWIAVLLVVSFGASHNWSNCTIREWKKKMKKKKKKLTCSDIL